MPLSLRATMDRLDDLSRAVIALQKETNHMPWVHWRLNAMLDLLGVLHDKVKDAKALVEASERENDADN